MRKNRAVETALLGLGLMVGVCASLTSAIAQQITVNGVSDSTSVPAGAAATIAVSGGPISGEDQTSWIGFCQHGLTFSQSVCDGAGYAWAHLNCTGVRLAVVMRS